jgi:hypothetical protein
VAEKRPQHVAERRVGELRQSARERQEVLQVRPHELRREHAVRRRAARERPAQVLAVVLPGAQGRVRRRGGRLVGRQQHRQVQVVRTAQVIAGSSRRARLDARLKYASGTPATPSSASVRQSSVLPLRGVAHTT